MITLMTVYIVVACWDSWKHITSHILISVCNMVSQVIHCQLNLMSSSPGYILFMKYIFLHFWNYPLFCQWKNANAALSGIWKCFSLRQNLIYNTVWTKQKKRNIIYNILNMSNLLMKIKIDYTTKYSCFTHGLSVWMDLLPWVMSSLFLVSLTFPKTKQITQSQMPQCFSDPPKEEFLHLHRHFTFLVPPEPPWFHL